MARDDVDDRLVVVLRQASTGPGRGRVTPSIDLGAARGYKLSSE